MHVMNQCMVCFDEYILRDYGDEICADCASEYEDPYPDEEYERIQERNVIDTFYP